MPPRRTGAQEGQQQISFEDFQALQSSIVSIQDTIGNQQQIIANLEAAAAESGSPASKASPLQSLKAPQIPAYSGKAEERTSVKVKGFIYNVKKVGALSGMDDARLLTLAECHFQEKAAAWIMRLKLVGQKPTTIATLQEAMIREFVPPDEKARAKVRLMNFQMKGTIDKHISLFQELVEICNTPLSEAYLFFFMSLTGNYKEELTKKFPTGDPKDMAEVYEHARTLDLAQQWSDKDSKRSKDNGPVVTGKKKTSSGYDNDRKDGKATKKTGSKEESAVTWGPVKPGEHGTYRAADRCMKCGEKVWSNLEHPCRKEWEQKKSSEKAPKA